MVVISSTDLPEFAQAVSVDNGARSTFHPRSTALSSGDCLIAQHRDSPSIPRKDNPEPESIPKG